MAIKELRDFVDGDIDEAALREGMTDDADIEEYLGDNQFMSECMEACLPVIVQTMMSDNIMEQLDEDVSAAVATLANYFAGQGIMNEASVTLNNRVNVTHLSKAAQIKRLTAIITLKMARRANHRAYKKYKIGQRIKKANRLEMDKVFGNRAAKVAKKLWIATHKSGKAMTVTAGTPTGQTNSIERNMGKKHNIDVYRSSPKPQQSPKKRETIAA